MCTVRSDKRDISVAGRFSMSTSLCGLKLIAIKKKLRHEISMDILKNNGILGAIKIMTIQQHKATFT